MLKPGGVAIFSFSNRMFYTKAITAWREGTEYSRVQLVKVRGGQCTGGAKEAWGIENTVCEAASGAIRSHSSTEPLLHEDLGS